ncbi:hypothetical protein C4K40_6352 [Pseudomonas sp. CMR5c]|nr:hypothetical protein C4K40_6352 [Pseudomonas sp. CMR5c]
MVFHPLDKDIDLGAGQGATAVKLPSFSKTRRKPILRHSSRSFGRARPGLSTVQVAT